jgi:tetratricopeptide (TPR) repeat protein
MSAVFRKVKYCLLALILAMTFCGTAMSASTTAQSEQLDFANGLFLRKMYSMAIDEYQKFIKTYPSASEIKDAYFMSAESFFFLNNYANAMVAYEDFRKRFPADENTALASLRIGMCLINLERYKEALDVLMPLKEMAAAQNLRADISYFLALAMNATGDKEGALRGFNFCFEQVPASLYASLSAYQLGVIAVENSNVQDALGFYEKAVQYAQNPDQKVKALVALAETQFNNKDYENAANNFRQAAYSAACPENLKSKVFLNMLSAFFNAGKYQTVIDEYTLQKGVPVYDTRDYRVVLVVSQSYTCLNKYDNAEAMLDSVLQSLAGSIPLPANEREQLLFEKVSTLIVDKKYSEALASLDKWTTISDQNRYSFLRAECLFYLNRFAEAKICYSRVIANETKSPHYPSALYGIGFSSFKNNEKKDAYTYFTKFLLLFPQDQRIPDELYMLIVLDNELGYNEDGITHAQEFIKKYTKDFNLEKVYFLLGRFYADLNKHEAVINTYFEYTRLFPSSKQIKHVYYLLGYSYEMLKKYSEANEWYEKIVTTKEPASLELYYAAQKNMVENYITLGESERAVGILEHMMKEETAPPLDIDVYIWIIKYYEGKTAYTDMVRVLESAISRNDAAFKTPEIQYYFGEAHRGLGEYKESLIDYQKSIDDDKTKIVSGGAYIGKGLSAKELGDLQGAYDAFQKAIAIDPDDATTTMRARYYCGELLYDQKKFEEAAKLFMMVAILYDDEHFVVDALYRAGDAFAKAGKINDASKTYTDFLTKYPNDKRVKNVQEMLRVFSKK